MALSVHLTLLEALCVCEGDGGGLEDHQSILYTKAKPYNENYVSLRGYTCVISSTCVCGAVICHVCHHETFWLAARSSKLWLGTLFVFQRVWLAARAKCCYELMCLISFSCHVLISCTLVSWYHGAAQPANFMKIVFHSLSCIVNIRNLTQKKCLYTCDESKCFEWRRNK